MSDRDYLRYDFPGEGPRNRFWAVYPATKAVIVALVGMWVLMLILKTIGWQTVGAVYSTLALRPDRVLEGLWLWQLVTYSWMHDFGIFHVGINCLMLYWWGKDVERRLGLKRYLLFLLGSIVAGSLAYLCWSLMTLVTTPMVGFSAAVLAVVVLRALWSPMQPVLLFGIFSMKLWHVAAIFVGLDVLMLLDTHSELAHAAHLGGALFGYIYFKYGGRFRNVFNALDQRAERKQRERARASEHKEREMREELDRILDKVNREGMPALSDEEKRFLKSASDRLRP
ncbi:MAG: rhomboid family intramembrane serine protease [Planctomycetota bacterium]|nr:rhomboid family intramembrane serine protease [Planctomycetota bacterium]